MDFVKKILNEKPEDKSGYPQSKSNIRRKYIDEQGKLLHEKYQINKEIGRGSDGIVRLCKLRSNYLQKINNKNNKNGKNKIKNDVRAIKIIDKSKVKPNHLKDIYNEMHILKQTSMKPHDNIVRFYESFETQNKIYIITELLSGDTLQDRIVRQFNNTKNSNKKGFDEITVAIMFYQILEALSYLHGIGVVHRDLKPENILFCKDSENTLKIIDFGLAGILTKHNNYKLTHPCGTPFYVSPEVIDPRNKTHEYDSKCDMWSAGIILYAMFCGCLPFKLKEDEPLRILYRQILKGYIPMNSSIWLNVPNDAKDLILRLLITDPNQRLNAKQAMDHSFFKRVFHTYLHENQ